MNSPSRAAIDTGTDAVVAREIAADERLLWSGRPLAGLWFEPAQLLPLLVAALVLAFAVSWIRVAAALGDLWLLAVVGVVVVAVALVALARPLLSGLFASTHTYYAVTDRRLIAISTLLGARVSSLALAAVTNTSKTRRADGSGTLSFGLSDAASLPHTAYPGAVLWGGAAATRREPLLTFRHIANVDAVDALIAGLRTQTP